MLMEVVKKLFLFPVSYIDFYFILNHYAIVDTKINFTQINEQNTIAYETIHNNPDKGLLLSREIFKNSKSIDYKKGMADSKLIEGWCLLLKNNYNNSLEALEFSLSAFKEIKDSHGEIKALNAIVIEVPVIPYLTVKG